MHLNPHTTAPQTARFAPLAWCRRPEVSTPLGRLLLLAFLHLLPGCNYYRNQTEESGSGLQQNVLNGARLLMMHQGNDSWLLINPALEGEMLKGTRSELTPATAKYANPRVTGAHRYRHADRSIVLNIVHIHINEYSQREGSIVAIPVSSIKRIDVVERDEGRTIASHVLGVSGGILAVLALLSIIIILTKSSCPFVYAYQGDGYGFVGETYGGSIFAPLERDDYMPLPPLEPVNGRYLVRISNELKERQYTNVAQLWAVEHPDSVLVLPDSTGRMRTVVHPRAPLKAVSATGQSFLQQLAGRDSASYLFHEDLPGNGLNHLELTFAKPVGVAEGKLVLRAQNSLWLDYLFGEFTKKFGSLYNRWSVKQRTESPEKLKQWQWDQGIPLAVYLHTPTGWQLAGSVPSVGPLAARDLVVPVDFRPVAGQKEAKLKIAGGFMFWELDYAAIDFSPDVPTHVEEYPLQAALTEKGEEVAGRLRQADKHYLEQDKPGTSVELSFEAPAPATPGMARTFFLRTRGYYEHVREYDGLPDMAELYAFRKPGRFIEFSREKYRETMKNLNPAVTARR